MSPIIPNGTDAKEIALHFIEHTSGKATPAIMKKTINQAKSLLQSGYTVDEIKQVIEYIVGVKRVHMYSLGYVSMSINDVKREMRQVWDEEKAIREKQQVREELSQAYEQNSEVKVTDVQSSERNRDKAGRLGVQSRFGKELDFDMFKE